MSNFSLLPSVSPTVNGKATSISLSIKKCKDGTGDNWSVEPGLQPFYLMQDSPVPEAPHTASKNLIVANGLEKDFQKFCTKKLKDELSAFLPFICGRVNVPSAEDGSGLLDIVHKPPVQGKELRPFAQTQLDHAFRLHPGPLPQEFSILFSSVTSENKSASSPTHTNESSAGEGSTSTTRKRRRDVHKANLLNVPPSVSNPMPMGLPSGSSDVLQSSMPPLTAIPGASIHLPPRPMVATTIPGALEQSFPSTSGSVSANLYSTPPQLQSLALPTASSNPSSSGNLQSTTTKPTSFMSHKLFSNSQPASASSQPALPTSDSLQGSSMDEAFSNNAATINILSDDEPSKKRKRKKEKKAKHSRE